MNKDMPGTIRKRFVVKGRVQKVNYRDAVQDIARTLGVTGFVKNLKSGDVEVVCEGDEAIIGKFEKALAIKSGLIDVREVVPDGTIPVKGKFTYFEIKYGPMEEELGERLGAGFQYIQEVGQKVDGVGKAVEGVGQKVDSMHSDMNKRFDHMADRYDMIAASLKEAIVHMDRNAVKTDKAIEKSRKETILAVRKSQKDTASMLARNHKETTAELSMSRKDFAASNRELAKAVNFMIKKMSGKPATAHRVSRKKRK